jgi:hypothetical protein
MQIYLQLGYELLKRLKHNNVRIRGKNAEGLLQILDVSFIIIIRNDNESTLTCVIMRVSYELNLEHYIQLSTDKDYLG